MRFAMHQRYRSKADPALYAEVIQLDDEGRKAWVQLRNGAGEAIKTGEWVAYAQFAPNWVQDAAIQVGRGTLSWSPGWSNHRWRSLSPIVFDEQGAFMVILGKAAKGVGHLCEHAMEALAQRRLSAVIVRTLSH